MNKKDIYTMTDEELAIEGQNLKKSKILHALAIGFLAGILVFGLIAWALSSEKNFGFLIPMLIPVFFIHRMLKKPNKNKELEELLKKRGLG
jgi:hypothetical protein